MARLTFVWILGVVCGAVGVVLWGIGSLVSRSDP